MKTAVQNKFAPFLLLSIVLLYCLLYAPYGINETDGGFITAYAWRMLNGEWPYRDFIYVRPPMSLFIRYAEMALLPETWEVIGERCLFFGKIALTNYLGAALLAKGNKKWWLATLGFVFSAHNYPAAAWHTVDGVLLGVIGLYGLFKSEKWLFPAALSTVFALLCKQSFYPLAPLFLLLLWLTRPRRLALKGTLYLMVAVAGSIGLFYATGTWSVFVDMSTGATTPGQLWEFGIFAMFRVDPRLILISMLLIPYLFEFRYPHLFYLFVAALIGFYAVQVYTHDFWIPPMKISRLLWMLSFIYGLGKIGQLMFAGKYTWFEGGNIPFSPLRRMKGWAKVGEEKKSDETRFWQSWREQKELLARLVGLLGLSWMTAISWGYNFPLFLSVPYFYVLGRTLADLPSPESRSMERVLQVVLLVAMLLVFRYGHSNIYRDEPRTDATCELGAIFPKLNLLKSSPETCKLYLDLKILSQKYSPTFKVLPSFPLANYLTDTHSPWPIDWVTIAEIRGVEDQIYEAMEQKGVYYLIEKSYGDQLLRNKKYETTKYLMQNMRKVEETEFFEVYVKE